MQGDPAYGILCPSMKTVSNRRLKKIAITATVSGEAGRSYLSGAFSYINAHRKDWTIEVFNNAEAIDRKLAESAELDGVLIMAPHQRQLLADLHIRATPTVIVDIPPPEFPKDFARLSFVRLDDEAIGVAAAEHLLSRSRFNAFACFIDEPQFKYPHIRETGFRKRLAAANAFVKTLTLSADNTSPRELRALHLTLDRLPRPLGVFAVRDRAAPRIYDYCKTRGILIPDEIAIVGVDNDEIFCNTQFVQLSSLLPDHGQIGYLAAKELARLMRGCDGREIVYAKSVKEVVLRASSRIVPPAARMISDMLAFIDGRSSGDLRVSDVAKAVGVSRRLADLRFRQSRGETILGAINRARLSKVKKLLFDGNRPIAEIADTCRFSSPAALTRFFRNQTGMTPTDWRKRP